MTKERQKSGFGFDENLFFQDDVHLILIDRVGGDDTADTGAGIDIGAAADDGAGVEHAVAAHLHIVAEDGAYFAAAGLNVPLRVADGDIGLVALDIAGDGACAHMGLIAQNRVAHIVIVGGLHIVKEDDIFKLAGVAHNRLLANDCTAPDKSAVAYLSFMINDAGRANVCRGENAGILGNPNALIRIIKFLRIKSGAQLKDKALYIIQNFPGIGLALEERGCNAVFKVQQIFDFNHITSPL